MILIDTSAWVEFLRDTGTPVCQRVDDLLDDEVAVCHPIRMEVLAGARNDTHLGQLRRLLARATILDTRPAHYDDAASLYRTCRLAGATPRKLIDCVIGAIAINASTPILHADADFDVLAEHTPLQLVEPR